MFRFPKKRSLALLNSYNAKGQDYFYTSQGEREYLDLTGQMFSIFSTQLATAAMAKYVLDVWMQVKKGYL